MMMGKIIPEQNWNGSDPIILPVIILPKSGRSHFPLTSKQNSSS